MADDSLEITEPFDYHPCNTPRGCTYYDIDILTFEQQTELNDLKNKIIRCDERYLANHPEVRAFIVLILQYVLKRRPRQNVHKVINDFFSRPRYEIEREVLEYISRKEKPLVYEEELEEESMEFNLKEYYKKILQEPVEEEIKHEPTTKKEDISIDKFVRSLLLERIYGFQSRESIENHPSFDMGTQRQSTELKVTNYENISNKVRFDNDSLGSAILKEIEKVTYTTSQQSFSFNNMDEEKEKRSKVVEEEVIGE